MQPPLFTYPGRFGEHFTVGGIAPHIGFGNNINALCILLWHLGAFNGTKVITDKDGKRLEAPLFQQDPPSQDELRLLPERVVSIGHVNYVLWAYWRSKGPMRLDNKGLFESSVTAVLGLEGEALEKFCAMLRGLFQQIGVGIAITPTLNESDILLVPGAKVQVLKKRLDHALEIRGNGQQPIVILTGGRKLHYDHAHERAAIVAFFVARDIKTPDERINEIVASCKEVTIGERRDAVAKAGEEEFGCWPTEADYAGALTKNVPDIHIVNAPGSVPNFADTCEAAMQDDAFQHISDQAREKAGKHVLFIEWPYPLRFCMSATLLLGSEVQPYCNAVAPKELLFETTIQELWAPMNMLLKQAAERPRHRLSDNILCGITACGLALFVGFSAICWLA